MKTKLKYLAVFVCLLGASFPLRAQGYIVPNGVTYAGTSEGPGYSIDVIHDPTNGFATGFSLVPLGKTPPISLYTNTFQFSPIVDVSVRVFFTSANQPITTNALLSGTMTELGYSPTSGYVFTNGIPFYLALYTGNQNFYPPDGVYTDPLFGWVQLVNNQGVIQMLGSALEYQGAGIYAGTQTIIQPVPEPGVLGLFALAGLSLFLVKNRQRQQS